MNSSKYSKKYCHNCGARIIRNESLFCYNCGVSLKEQNNDQNWINISYKAEYPNNVTNPHQNKIEDNLPQLEKFENITEINSNKNKKSNIFQKNVKNEETDYYFKEDYDFSLVEKKYSPDEIISTQVVKESNDTIRNNESINRPLLDNEIQQKNTNLPLSQIENTENEIYLGGFKSANLIRGIIRGYGIYLTNKRIFGQKSIGTGIGSAIITVGLFGGPIGGAINPLFSAAMINDNEKVIHDLEEKHDFCLLKKDIKEIEFKCPSLLMGGGYMLIKSNSSDDIKIKIAYEKEYNMIIEAFKEYIPGKILMKS